MKRTIVLIILIFTFSFVKGQKYYCKNITINDGLPDNCINELYKDSRGFLWIGTNAGLAKYDGKNFQTYSSQDGLAGDNIQSISESKDGCIWVGFKDGGISRLHGDKIKTYTTDNGLISNKIKKILYSDKFNILIIGTENGISVLKDSVFSSFHSSNINNKNLEFQASYFIETNSSILIFTQRHGVFEYFPSNKKIIPINKHKAFQKLHIHSAFISSQNDTLLNLDKSSLTIINKDFQNTFDNIGIINCFKEDSDKSIWIASKNNNYLNRGGIFKYHNSKIERFNSYLSINDYNINALEFDYKENILWIGTQENGLYLYPLTNFSYFNAKDFSVSELNIRSLHFDKNEDLWIATKNEVIKKTPGGNHKVFKFELFQKKFNHFSKNEMAKKYSYLLDNTGSFEKYDKLITNGKYKYKNPYSNYINNKITPLPTKSLYKPLKYEVLTNKKINEITNIESDNKGNIWVGSNVGIFKIEENSENITFFDIEANYLSEFIFDSKNVLYAVSWNELFIFPDIENNKNYSLYNYYEHQSPINVNRIKEYNNKLWFISHDHGLFVYNYKKFYSTYIQSYIKNKSFKDICFDQNGNVIIGAINGNIYIGHFNNDSLYVKYKINKNNGLLGSSIRWLNCYNNQLIAGTNSGFNIINLERINKTGTIEIESIDKGRGFTDYSGKVSVTDNNNNIWVGTNENLVKINIEKLNHYKNTYISFFIKSVEINDKNYDIRKLEDIDPWTNVPKSPIKLPYYKNSLTFYYDVIKYTDPDRISFSYKLEGYQETWSKETKDRKAVFQNLEPGNYRLRIKVFNNNELETNQELSISIIINPPIWAKWWIIAPSILFIIFLVWLIIHKRTKSIKKRERLKSELSERVNELEMKALRSQMNPHFIFNAINSIQNFMLDNNVDSALNYLSDFAKLIRLTLDNVSRKQVTLEEELNYLKYYIKLEQMRFENKFKAEIVLPFDDFELKNILIPPMIIQPYIENSIKHGFILKNKNGKIKMEFNISDDDMLKCIVEDNGIGREKAKSLSQNNKHKSKGTFITNERLSLLNQTQQKKGYKINTIDLFDKYNLPCGTRVEIDIPI